MGRWESLIEQKIREAMEQGEFDELSGKGAPIDLSENPFEDPESRLAHRLLRNAGFAPSWIEERKDIDAEVKAARAQLGRSWMLYQRGTRWRRCERECSRTLGEKTGGVSRADGKSQSTNNRLEPESAGAGVSQTADRH